MGKGGQRVIVNESKNTTAAAPQFPKTSSASTKQWKSPYDPRHMLAGIDFIGDYLTEINVTCPTGLRAAQRLYGLNLASRFWDCVLQQR